MGPSTYSVCSRLLLGNQTPKNRLWKVIGQGDIILLHQKNILLSYPTQISINDIYKIYFCLIFYAEISFFSLQKNKINEPSSPKKNPSSPAERCSINKKAYLRVA